MKRTIQKEQTKQKLQQVAIRLFQQQGYQKTTVSQITDEAGVAKGTFFNYFKSKEEVLHTLGEKQLLLFEQHTKELLQSEQPITSSIHQLFQLLVRSYEEANPQLVRSLFHISITNETFHRSEVLQIEQMKHSVILLIDEGKRRGEFKENISSEEVGSSAILHFYGILLYWCTNPHQLDISLQQKISHSLSILLSGIQHS
ncbi:TetR/AcrR family transcriptional regulator [Metabacillus iocasae]|uniref:AcrR family transcriptional regulator n=1 Tax=Priestia iocasae TaxID=2291674 RepID=A0ABS2QYX1_9BACI|nr:TetR/AcrR family transcriptional regulator [Metabacillus iocasae]MBM7704685.1 AcrR family transcriptional regulator [Metabacillus iocasae]